MSIATREEPAGVPDTGTQLSIARFGVTWTLPSGALKAIPKLPGAGVLVFDDSYAFPGRIEW